MTRLSTLAVVLAAGKGTRMRSELPKVLHPLAGRPMVVHCLEALQAGGVDETVLVVGYGRDLVRKSLEAWDLRYAIQEEQLGTGHAVARARTLIEGFDGNVLVTYGDMPLLSPTTIRAVVEGREASGAAASVLTIELDNPPDFGRIVRDGDGRVVAIVEARDATPEQLARRELNVGAYCFEAAALLDSLDRLAASNAQGEYYLTDVIGILAAGGRRVETVTVGRLEEALGINDRRHLDFAEKLVHIRFAESRYPEVDSLAREAGG